MYKNSIKLHTRYHVTAYDESYASYGDNASRDFEDEASAITYARKNFEQILHLMGHNMNQ